MMPRLIDKSKIYFYLLLFFTLISTHNLNKINLINNLFKIKNITVENNLEKDFKEQIISSLDKFYDLNIFSINSAEIIKIFDTFNIISEYEIKKEYPSNLKIKLKKTNIIAYYLFNNQPIFIGENGKKIDKIKIKNNNLPIIEGKIDINNFLYLKNKLLDHGFAINDFVKFHYHKSNRWDAIYKNQFIVKLPSENLDTSLILLKKIIQLPYINDVKIIDLRIKNRIILS